MIRTEQQIRDLLARINAQTTGSYEELAAGAETLRWVLGETDEPLEDAEPDTDAEA